MTRTARFFQSSYKFFLIFVARLCVYDFMQSLAQFLGDAVPDNRPSSVMQVETLTAAAFADAVVQSVEFRNYIVNGLILGTIPPAIVIRVLDLAGWTKPPERIEHTGKDGAPIETVTEVRRVVVHATSEPDYEHVEMKERTH